MLSTTAGGGSSSRSVRKRALITSPADNDLQPRSRARRDVLSTEVETLNAELEHERSLRALDAKRFQKVQQRLERQVEFAAEEAEEAKTMMEEIRDESDALIEQMRQARLQTQEEMRDLQLQLEEERAIAATAVLEDEEDDPRKRHLQAELQAKATENEALHKTIQNIRQEFHQLQEEQRVASKSASNEDGDDELLHNINIPGASEAPPAVLRELHRVRIQLAEMERKNRQLRRATEDLQKKAKQLVHERESARSATARVQALEAELQDLSGAHAKAELQTKSWKEFGATLGTILVPNDDNVFKDVPPEAASVKRYLNNATKQSEQLRVENKHLRQQVETADDQKRKLESSIRELEGKELSWKTEKQDLQKKIDVGDKQMQLLKSQERIWKRELESLRSIVKTFDELPLPGKSTASSASVRALETSVKAAMEEVAAFKEAQTTLQQELDKLLKEKAQLQTKHNTVLEKFGKIREAVYEERAKSEKAEARAVRAEQLSGKGAFNPETTRVVHLRHNPVTEALKQEVSVLKRQLEALGGKQAAASAAVGSDVDPNKLHKRLKESFKEQIGRFREGVYLLTGFKIDMIPENDRPRFKVRSMFAEQETDHLMFKWPEGEDVAGLDLLGSDLAKILMTTPSY
jgi:mitotic spindle assembly checkpoint protein MAD1